jgi:hypothetical protein
MKFRLFFLAFLFNGVIIAQEQCAFVQFADVANRLAFYRAGELEIKRVAQKYADSINRVQKRINSNDSVDEINSVLDEMKKIYFDGRREIDMLRFNIDSIALFRIEKHFSAFLKKYDLENVSIKMDSIRIDSCINYSNLYSRYLNGH